MKDIKNILLKKRGSSFEQYIKRAFAHMSLIEKALVLIAVLVLVISTLLLIRGTYFNLSSETPTYGGSLHEGVYEQPRFINPILALNTTDHDLSSLIYAGLLRVNTSGELEPHLAKDLPQKINDTTYQITLRENLTFHDGTPLSADDVIFTIESIQNPLIRSALQGDWAGVFVEKVDEHTIRFTLPHPYDPFTYNLTVGILPEHIWRPIGVEQFAFSDRNINPIGAGPYKISKIDKNSNGAPKRYVLKAFNEYVLGKPYIETLTLTLFNSPSNIAEALNRGSIDSAVVPQFSTLKDVATYQYPMRRVYAVFLQDEHEALKDEKVRRALNLATPKGEIVKEALGSQGEEISSPLPSFFWDSEYTELPSQIIEKTPQELLQSSGWQKNDETGTMEKKIGNTTESLSFTLHTSNTPELIHTADILRRAWKEQGIDVKVEVHEIAYLIQNVIRPRTYDALLFGQVLSRENDLYAYWHSEAQSDPGLNVSLFSNPRTDALLEKLRAENADEERIELYKSINQEITEETPAVFLYVPTVVYGVPEEIHGIKEYPLVHQSERFLDIHTWYRETKRTLFN